MRSGAWRAPLELTLLFFFLAIEKRERRREPVPELEENQTMLCWATRLLFSELRPVSFPSFHKMRPKRTLSPSESENTASDSPIRIHTDTAALVDDKGCLFHLFLTHRQLIIAPGKELDHQNTTRQKLFQRWR
jgi:hypothetical protein